MFSYVLTGLLDADKIKHLLKYPWLLIFLGEFEVQAHLNISAAILLLLKKDKFLAI